jgi:predicted nucleic acid-binding Zn ribbon protein
MCALPSQKRKMMVKVLLLAQELPRWMTNRQMS